MSAAELEHMAGISDLQPSCPVKVVEREELSPFGPLSPILPVPVDEDALAAMDIEPRSWKYQVC